MKDNAYNDKYLVTSGIKRRFKETENGQDIMCEIIEKIRSEAKAEGFAKGQVCVSKLYTILIDASRYDDIKRSTTDINYQTQLMYELLPEKLA